MLPVRFWTPSITETGSNVTYVPEGKALRDMEGLGEFNFALEADGGCWQLDLSFDVNESEIDGWIQSGLGRHVEVYNDALVKRWEGFVNSIDAVVGGLSVTRGPLMDICNRCSVRYSRQYVIPAEGSDEDTIETEEAITAIADDDESQLKYGVFEQVLSGGTIWDDYDEDAETGDNEAEMLRDAWMEEYSLPETTKRFALGSGGLNLRVSCLGYINFLSNYKYVYDDAEDLSDPIYDPTDSNSKLRLVLEADPNNLFVDDTKWDFDTVQVIVARKEERDIDALTLIRNMVALGDNSNNRCLFGVYPDRKIRYNAVPSTLTYEQTLGETQQRIRRYGGSVVEPWDIDPGEWLLFTDFLVGKTVPTNLREDQRALFIERVAYSTPNGLSIDGGKIHNVQQALARLGVGT